MVLIYFQDLKPKLEKQWPSYEYPDDQAGFWYKLISAFQNIDGTFIKIIIGQLVTQ